MICKITTLRVLRSLRSTLNDSARDDRKENKVSKFLKKFQNFTLKKATGNILESNMSTVAQIFFSALTLLGVGGIIGGYITFLLDKKKELEFRQLENKEKRYKSCLLYMDVFFEPKNIKYLSSRHSDINNSQDVIEYLKAEYHEMLLYASKEVLLSVKKFIDTPTRENFLKTVLNMRQDLWIKRNDLDLESIRIDFQDNRQKKS